MVGGCPLVALMETSKASPGGSEHATNPSCAGDGERKGPSEKQGGVRRRAQSQRLGAGELILNKGPFQKGAETQLAPWGSSQTPPHSASPWKGDANHPAPRTTLWAKQRG